MAGISRNVNGSHATATAKGRPISPGQLRCHAKIWMGASRYARMK